MDKKPFLIDGLDPYDPNLTKEQQLRIMDILRKNPYMFYLFIIDKQMKNMKSTIECEK